VIATPPGTPPFVENTRTGRELTVGGAWLRVTLPTPRCSVPTLEHGDRPRAPHAVRGPLEQNRVEVTGFGVLPCAGAYAEVRGGGTVRTEIGSPSARDRGSMHGTAPPIAVVRISERSPAR
jgi:uncharacterized protein YcbX